VRSFAARLDRIERELAEVRAAGLADVGRFERWRDDPCGFAAIVLGRELWSKQAEICRAVLTHPVTVVPAGRACGKSYCLSVIALWWLYTRRNSRVITTAPDHRQVATVLWGEMRRAVAGSREQLPYETLTAGLASPQRLVIDGLNRWECLGWSANQSEGMAGQHGGELLCIVDEASGVHPAIWESIHGLASNRLIVAGNPIRWESRFRELNDLAEAGNPQVTSVRISSLESPHAETDHSPVGLADSNFIRLNRDMWGEGSPWWRSNILALFPSQESSRFLPAAWLDAGADPSIKDDEIWQDYPAGPAVMACDIGGGVGADRSVVVVRDRKQLLAVFSSNRHGILDDAEERLEPIVIAMAAAHCVSPSNITYDQSGIGRSFGSYLAAHGLEGTVGYFGAGKGGPHAINRRSASSYALRKRLDPHRDGYVPFYVGGIPEWPSMREELAAMHHGPMAFEEGVVKQSCETKEAWAARLKRSPDLADALIQSFTYP
jgi:hypothetical protein